MHLVSNSDNPADADMSGDENVMRKAVFDSMRRGSVLDISKKPIITNIFYQENNN